VQAARIVLRRDREAVLREHRPGIQARVHLHDGDAGLAVARQQRALDRRRAAPARQQRSMNVHGAQARRPERARRQQQAVGGDHHDVGARPLQHPEGLVGFQAVRLEDLEIPRKRELLDRAGCGLQAAAGGPVRLRQHQRDFVAGRQQRGQRACRELGSACED
jgi:hypothetical protein